VYQIETYPKEKLKIYAFFKSVFVIVQITIFCNILLSENTVVFT